MAQQYFTILFLLFFSKKNPAQAQKRPKTKAKSQLTMLALDDMQDATSILVKAQLSVVYRDIIHK